MKMNKFWLLIAVFPLVAFAADRDAGVVSSGAGRVSRTEARLSIGSVAGHVGTINAPTVDASVVKNVNTKDARESSVAVSANSVETNVVEGVANSTVASGNCREAYRQCMDDFCLLDESQGERCACSDNIEYAKSKIKEVLNIQAEADKLYTEGVEREQLGAKARFVFTENADNKSKSGAGFFAWLNSDEDTDEDVGEDTDIGDALYEMASQYCQAELDACGSKAEMESMLYSRMIVQDCKNYDSYLKDQKANAESNKRIAESAVRKARLEMLDTTNKYNRGECLLAYRSCIADKGGCGANFENCLDEKLLQRRANACENILDQCLPSRDYVIKDWKEESISILEEAAKYTDRTQRATCLARIQDCLEESCATSTNADCLIDVNVAAGICPVITECDAKIPGLQTVLNSKLAYLQTKFCENDVDKCLQDKCGIDFTKPECVGKKAYEIAQLCPQSMFPSCSGATQYGIIVQSALLQMDYQIMQGCINYFSDQLSKVCGTDMSCLPVDTTIPSLINLPDSEKGFDELRQKIVMNADGAVEEFFRQFENDKTVAACADLQSTESKKVKGKTSLSDSVFNSAKLIAKMAVENRNLRELDSRIAELTRKKDLETAKQTCLKTYQPEKPKESKSNYSYIHTVSFESKTRNCHVCRIQQVCEEGGESKASAALKAAAGGLSAGASMGTMVNAGWGTAIGGVIGAVGAGALGAASGGKKEFCQEIESCEDINY